MKTVTMTEQELEALDNLIAERMHELADELRKAEIEEKLLASALAALHRKGGS